MPKWVYPLAFLFVLFLIYTDPSRAGDTAGNFATFVVDLLGSVGEFLTGLFEGASDAGGTVTTPPTSVDPTSTATTVAEQVGTFTHSHGDFAPHTHPSTGG